MATCRAILEIHKICSQLTCSREKSGDSDSRVGHSGWLEKKKVAVISRSFISDFVTGASEALKRRPGRAGNYHCGVPSDEVSERA